MAAPMGCIGLDFGTTHIKAGLFDQAGKRIRLEKVPTPQARDDYGTVYDPAQIAETVTGLLQTLAETGVPIRLISVTGMAEAGVMVERGTGRCLCPLLPWFDPRTQALAGAVSREEAHRRFFQTGLRNSFKYGIYKYRWAMAHTRAAPEQTLWLSAVDYLVYLLTGQAVTDPTYAARTYAYNLDTGDFDWEYLSPLGLGRDNFPRVVPSGSRVGLCRLPGLTGAAVHIAAHDHVSAAFAISLAAEGWICDSCGTAETYIGTFPARPLTEADWRTGCIYGPYPGNRRFWMANISSSGLAVEWFRQQVQLTRLDGEFAPKRRELAELYRERLSGVPGVALLTAEPEAWIVPHIFPVRILNGRQHDVIGALDAKGIPTGQHYKPNHLLSLYGGGKPSLPATEQLHGELLTLPLHPGLSREDVEAVCAGIIEAVK